MGMKQADSEGVHRILLHTKCLAVWNTSRAGWEPFVCAF